MAVLAEALAAGEGVPLTELMTTSDAIVVGTVVDQVEHEGSATVMLSVEREVAGRAPANRALAIELSKGGGILAGERGLWFLRRAASGVYAAQRVERDGEAFYYRVGSGALPHPFFYTRHAPAIEKALMEIGASLESFPAEAVRLEGALRGLDSTEVTMLIERFARSESTELRRAAVSALTQRGGLSAIRRAGNYPGVQQEQTRSRVE